MDENLKKRQNETNNEYIWRIASLKDSGALDFSWQQLADLFNSQISDSNQTESSYRKAYQYAKKFYDDVFSKLTSNEENVAELKKIQNELYMEKIKLRDERNAINAMLRAKARTDENFSIYEKTIVENSIKLFPKNKDKKETNNNHKAIVCCLSDIHYGMSFNSFAGKYNSSIAAQRMHDYCQKIIEIGQKNNADSCYVTILGDCISGNIHKNIQISNRENVIQQIIGCSALISEFVYTLSLHFDSVYANSVGGNHSRIDCKEDAVKDERLDDLIIWYLQTALNHIDNVHIDMTNKIDSTIAMFDIFGKKYISVHGDYDTMKDSDVAKLCMWIGFNPDYIFYGHLHHVQMNYVNNIGMIRCGCLSGSGDDYTVERRLGGDAYQVACICDKDGIESIYPVRLD